MFTLNDAKIELPKYVYTPGETITGKVITYIPNPTKVSMIQLSFYGLYIPPWQKSSSGNEGVIFAKQNTILVKEQLCSSYMYDFVIPIPIDIYPEHVSNSTHINNHYSGWWEKIGADIIAEMLGTRELLPGYRFFLDVMIDIPWWKNVVTSLEITINPKLWETIDNSSISL
jgi:hypothetical protein